MIYLVAAILLLEVVRLLLSIADNRYVRNLNKGVQERMLRNPRT